MELINNDKIIEIYNSKIYLPDEYFTKYELVPECPIKSWNYSWQFKDFARAWSIFDFIEWINKHKIQINNLAYTCEEDPELEFISPLNKELLEYPKYDLHYLDIKEKYDFFLFNQTIEHLHNPFLAIKNIYNSLQKNGYVFTSVPTLNIPHMTPIHFNGYTPMGLAMLFINCGFEVIEIGQWGNYEYIRQLWETHDWPDFYRLQKDGRVSNEERNVCQCWILAKKI